LRGPGSKALLWEMRVGKTTTLIQGLHTFGPVLIVCPKPVMAVWMEELRADGFAGESMAISSKEAREPWILPTFTVANYECVMRMPEDLLAQFQTVILDEAVRIKNPQAKIAKFFVENFRQAKRIVASGNIAPESPLEYFTPMKFLYDEWMGCKNFWVFRNRYFTCDFKGWAWWPKSAGVRERIKNAVAESASILTRKQIGMANQKIYEKRVIPLPDRTRKLYNEMEQKFAVTLPSGAMIETMHVITQVNYLAQIAGGGTKDELISDHKTKELLSLLQGELANEKVVVWFRYNFELNRVADALLDAGIPCGFLFGGVDAYHRRETQKSFNEGRTRVLLVQVKVGLYGLNLSTSSTAIYYSLPLSGNERTQSEDRIEHRNKKEPLLYVDLVAEKTIDEDIRKALFGKHRDSRWFIGDVIERFKERTLVGGGPRHQRNGRGAVQGNLSRKGL
jgi:SNF2 family DNA or RNA helicase